MFKKKKKNKKTQCSQVRWAGGCSCWYDTCLQRSVVLWRRCWCQSRRGVAEFMVWDGYKIACRSLQNIFIPLITHKINQNQNWSPTRQEKDLHQDRLYTTSPWLPWLEGFVLILMTSPWKHHIQIKWTVVQVAHFGV